MATKTQHQESGPGISRDEIERGRAQVGSELDAAQAAVDQAAYRAAIHHAPEHREALAAAQQRLAALQAELSALDAVSREVVRVERAQGQQAAMADLDTLEARATAVIDAVPVAYRKAHQALEAFSDAWRSLLETKEAARALVIRTNPQIVRQSGGLELEGVVMALREQVLLEFGEALSVAGVLQRTPEQIIYNAEWGVEAARRSVRVGVEQKRNELRRSAGARLDPPEA